MRYVISLLFPGQYIFYKTLQTGLALRWMANPFPNPFESVISLLFPGQYIFYKNLQTGLALRWMANRSPNHLESQVIIYYTIIVGSYKTLYSRRYYSYTP